MASGTNDTYTNVSTVIVNNDCDDDSPCSEEENDGHETNLVNFLAMQSQEHRTQAFDEYPELAQVLKPLDNSIRCSSIANTETKAARIQKTWLDASSPFLDPASLSSPPAY